MIQRAKSHKLKVTFTIALSIWLFCVVAACIDWNGQARFHAWLANGCSDRLSKIVFSGVRDQYMIKKTESLDYLWDVFASGLNDPPRSFDGEYIPVTLTLENGGTFETGCWVSKESISFNEANTMFSAGSSRACKMIEPRPAELVSVVDNLLRKKRE